ncbi:hypothetical protein B0T26DRAFT_669568 [Lasiosphaeria miniovina]|uniref:Methyltransferase domain-containing protein n=1 Tax=Lasiosphaeria miniovina TaxID=1954250 RepID=A0AA40EAT6_9PEZI|nr:uncharacterized protein B0T26DRAFT_669568 [Lasiosphaeria miniovina]KAK0733130.1 hypothetical protein B0T26DRAFT_669568 [Lasiosphaeria miniovina]
MLCRCVSVLALLSLIQIPYSPQVDAIKLVKEVKGLVAARWKPECVIYSGCGPGTSTKVLGSEFPDARIFGIDSSPSMIEAAKTMERAKEVPTATYVHGNIETYVPEDGTDLIFSTEALQYLHPDAQIETLQHCLDVARLEEVYPRDANGKTVLKRSMLLCVCVEKAEGMEEEGMEEEGMDEEELDEVDIIVLPPEC